MEAIHITDNYLINPTNPVTVNLIGAGATGSNMFMALAKMNHALIALGHPGLQACLYDDDTVSEANLMVNGEFLTAAQKENYRKGKEVKLPDGTRFNFTATDSHGIRSNKLALIASILIDGGLSYMVYRGLNALFNEKRDETEAAKLSPAYYNAVRDMEDQRNQVGVQNAELNVRTLKR
jgi:hypothetical protein